MTKCVRWTAEEDEIFKSHYGKISCEEICRRGYLPGRTRSSLHNRADDLGLKNGNRRILHSFDESFWKNPNPINAYWAGEIAADGCIRKNGNISFVLSLETSIADLEHVKKFKEAIKHTSEITFNQKACSLSKNGGVGSFCKMSISRAQLWKDDLENIWGIVPKKTYNIIPPHISNNILKLSYLIGYLDGDGTITVDSNRATTIIRFTSCTEKILLWFKQIFDAQFNVRAIGNPDKLPEIHKYGNCYYYSISGFRALKIIEILSRLPVPKLDRKWKNPEMLASMERIKVKYPDLWSARLPIEDEIDAFLSTYQPKT